jgi:hypothetical protein
MESFAKGLASAFKAQAAAAATTTIDFEAKT